LLKLLKTDFTNLEETPGFLLPYLDTSISFCHTKHMPNDDLGTFPLPSTPSDNSSDPSSASQTDSLPTPPAQSTTPPEPVPPQEPSFEETPEVIPTYTEPQSPLPQEEIPTPSTNLINESEKLVEANENLIEAQKPSETLDSEPVPQEAQAAPLPPQEPQAAEAPKKKSSAPIVIILVLLIVAGIGLAYSAYLSQQAANLKSQLQEITQTLEKQQTSLTPTPTSTIYEVPTPTDSLQATKSATLSATPTPLILSRNNLLPLANAASALKVAINRSPNAQLILIKVDSAESTASAVTKYFFREDLTTKKYFYVAISGTGNPQLVDKQIYVTPDDNIPSLNDAVLTNKLGIDLDKILKITYSQCSAPATCASSPIKAQYIKTGSGILWQVSVYNNGLTSSPLVMQLNAEGGNILYKSPGFSTM